jgi:histidinol-phosphate aminotransferase
VSWVESLARPEIVALKPYEHAPWQASGIRLHANELPWRANDDESLAGLNRYPEPQARVLLARLAELYRVEPQSLLMCRGSDEAIDLLTRTFCRAQRDAVMVCPPTFGMYAVATRIQGADVLEVPLAGHAGFALDTAAIRRHLGQAVKLIFLCSPNNPTGNALPESEILEVADACRQQAIVVVDEAYIEFSERSSLARAVSRRPNLAVLRTLSKAHGLAGARLGVLIADPQVIALLRKVIAPYAVPQLVLEAVASVLSPVHLRALPRRIGTVRAERARMSERLARLPGVTDVLPSEANFLLARFKDAAAALRCAAQAGIQVRDARSYLGLSDALRITIGTVDQNDRLLKAWA